MRVYRMGCCRWKVWDKATGKKKEGRRKKIFFFLLTSSFFPISSAKKGARGRLEGFLFVPFVALAVTL